MVSRRIALRRAAALLAAPWSAAPAAAQQKVSKADAQYQEHPKGQQRCEICLQFRPPANCNLVDGTIRPQGWCQFFAARDNAQ